MKELAVNIEELIDALGNGSDDVIYYLDGQTGEVRSYIEDGFCDLEEENSDNKDIEEDTTGRFIQIESLESYESYEHMREFVETVADEKNRLILGKAITGKGAFRRFKDALHRCGEEREKWFAFQHGKLMELAKEWLQAHDIVLKNEDVGKRRVN